MSFCSFQIQQHWDFTFGIWKQVTAASYGHMSFISFGNYKRLKLAPSVCLCYLFMSTTTESHMKWLRFTTQSPAYSDTMYPHSNYASPCPPRRNYLCCLASPSEAAILNCGQRQQETARVHPVNRLSEGGPLIFKLTVPGWIFIAGHGEWVPVFPASGHIGCLNRRRVETMLKEQNPSIV